MLHQTKDILLTICKEGSDLTFKELFRSVKIKDCLNDDGHIILSKLLDILKHNYNAPIESISEA